ncbi:glycine N-acyltransferase-like protein 3 [Platysternon megacephalum]|uniref:Glycine N-acyltransferase-like protein 3 n=1 Tax=Platysternon megacephalum TaxID=55544 RepID=A0A4D9DRU4_9SAUR|nr:glycine N-acyltransferase-like protein 3 [Platysternon megacephalum]
MALHRRTAAFTPEAGPVQWCWVQSYKNGTNPASPLAITLVCCNMGPCLSLPPKHTLTHAAGAVCQPRRCSTSPMLAHESLESRLKVRGGAAPPPGLALYSPASHNGAWG